jgi:hypothetical protein
MVSAMTSTSAFVSRGWSGNEQTSAAARSAAGHSPPANAWNAACHGIEIG